MRISKIKLYLPKVDLNSIESTKKSEHMSLNEITDLVVELPISAEARLQLLSRIIKK